VVLPQFGLKMKADLETAVGISLPIVARIPLSR
jgi:hypothetical protein